MTHIVLFGYAAQEQCDCGIDMDHDWDWPGSPFLNDPEQQ